MIKTKKLNCGVTLVMEPMDNMQSTAIGIWVKAGAVNEEENDAGISHFIEHMMFKGTESRTAKGIAEDVDKIGGQINAFTGKEATCYYIKTLASNLEKSMDILLDMFNHSVFDKEEMEREKQVIYEEMKMIQDSPDEDVHDIICELIFKGKPLGKSIIGMENSLKRIDRAHLKKYLREQYTTDSVVVAIAGKMDENQVIEILEKHFEGLNKKQKERIVVVKDYSPSFQVKTKDIEQSHLSIGIPTISLTHEDYYAYALVSNILGGTMSSRLFQNVREQKGLAYSIYSMNTGFSDEGYFNIYAGVSHDKVEEAIVAIKEELNALTTKGIDKKELEKAKEQMKAQYIFGQESVNGRMFSIGKTTTLLEQTYELDQVIEEIDSVDLEKMAVVSEALSDIDEYSGAIISNREWNIESMIRGNRSASYGRNKK